MQALPPDAALADVSGSLRYFGTDATALAERIRARTGGLYGLRSTVGVAANPLLARMVAADGPPSAVRTLPDDIDTVTAFLAKKPAAALQGVGPATARTLSSYGLDSVGRIAAAPLGTLQRILGATAGRRLHDAARGLDPTPVIPSAASRSMSVEHRFAQDELDRERQRAALLSLTDRLGLQLRAESQAARTHPQRPLRGPFDDNPHPEAERTHRPHTLPDSTRLRAPRPARPSARPRPHPLPAGGGPDRRRTDLSSAGLRSDRRESPPHRGRRRPRPEPVRPRDGASGRSGDTPRRMKPASSAGRPPLVTQVAAYAKVPPPQRARGRDSVSSVKR